jgi:hypothetical protein
MLALRTPVAAAVLRVDPKARPNYATAFSTGDARMNKPHNDGSDILDPIGDDVD